LSGICIEVVIERDRLSVAVTYTISADDPRTIRAIEIAAGADQWLTGHNQAGEEVFGVPSQSEPGRYYIVTRRTCDCPDFRNSTEAESRSDRACKHVLAVRLHGELARAERLGPAARSRHLRVLRNSD
jgi:hypothetical protein